MRQPFGENLIGGDSWNWTLRLEDVDVESLAGATLKYFFRGSGSTDQKLDITAEASTDGTFQFSATSEDTVKLVGSCTFSLCLFDADGNRTELVRGTVNVLPDVESADGTTDLRSWTKRTLDAVKAVLEGRASRVEEEYQIGGRHVKLFSPSELLKLKGDLQSAYNRELVESGQKRSNTNQVRVGFGPKQTGTGVWR
jgi:hypothetical protein